MKKIAIFVSGGGTNLQRIAEYFGDNKNVEISLVVCNNPEAYAIKRAKNLDIPVRMIDRTVFKSEDFARELAALNLDLIVLAGFMSILSADFTKRYERRIINVHPSLIPSFCGDGYYGLKVHEAALARGVKVTGATVHFVDAGTDTGPIIAQKAVYIEEGDTPETLQRRVMEQAEWIILPEAIAKLQKELDR